MDELIEEPELRLEFIEEMKNVAKEGPVEVVNFSEHFGL